MIRKKASMLPPESREHLEEQLVLVRRKPGEQLALRALDRLHALGVPLASLGRELGADGAAIARIVRSDDELLSLEAVDKLGDVRSHARAALRKRAQRQGLARSHELRESAELRERQPKRLESGIEVGRHRIQ